MFQTVLIANRGEIACRIIRTLRRMGLRSVAVYSDADARASHVREADVAVRLGPARASESYLDIDRVIAAARASGADAVHPGYGFLSENAGFARACRDAGLVFIGPDPDALEVMGDKISAKKRVESDGVQGIPGIAEPGLSDEQLCSAAEEIGFPVLIKPSAGGGGKGMIDVRDRADLPEGIRTARRIATAAFGDDTLFIERLVTAPRHIEVQVLADDHGNVLHVGERECSLQRRHQKVIEEAPSPLLDDRTRERIGRAACDVARSVSYRGAGTVEFLVSADRPGEFFFMEMNTRLQVEHPVTEQVTGIDLVEQQVLIAQGHPLAIAQEDIIISGHSIEARLYAEDDQFLPQAGTVSLLRFPEHARVDSGIAEGVTVGTDYDPMLAKIIATAQSRTEALQSLDRALRETVVFGVTTNTRFLRGLLADSDVQAGTMDTTTIDTRSSGDTELSPADDLWGAAALVCHAHRWESAGASLWAEPSGWRLGLPARGIEYRLGCGDQTRVIMVSGPPPACEVDGRPAAIERDGDDAVVRIGDRAFSVVATLDGHQVWIHDGSDATEFTLTHRDERSAGTAAHGDAAEPELRAPMPGTVVAISVANGAHAEAGDTIAVIEAMKMEHRLVAPTAGVVALSASTGQTVSKDAVIATVTADTAGAAEPSHEDEREQGENA
ncbi:biotin carboxylase N-terminal domain-containing protein [Paramicrobacterium sp. CJ85]|uniref:acetyl/propionyl/methylcrotonyl-CoA carboxylase subunit alpha n=1 Tax=Paramicrobacterium sp. CJ85 TaxID=3445355 RepID=UPI003F5FFCA2